MTELPMAALRGRVLVAHERVKFADADPYGHLASGAYVDMVMSHRVEALDDRLGFSIVGHARSGVAYPARSIAVEYLRPAFVGERLELGSWIEAVGTRSFEVRVVVAGEEDRAARALAVLHFVAVDSRTAKAMPVPEALPSAASGDPISDLPLVADYLRALTGIPEGWLSSDAP